MRKTKFSMRWQVREAEACKLLEAGKALEDANSHGQILLP